MQISKHIHAIHIPFTIPFPDGRKLPRSVYAYLVTGDKICLVDSGVAGGESFIFEYLAGLGKKTADIDLLLFTHAHPDHIGGAKTIREKCGCSSAAHREARAWIDDIDKQFADRPVPGFYTLVAGSTAVERLLEDNDTVDLGNLSLRVIHTPGHSRDSISLFCPEDGVLISGDAVPYNRDLPIYEDLAASVQSIRRLQQTTGLKTLLSSWREPQPAANPNLLLDEALQHLQKIHDIVRSVTAVNPKVDPMELCRSMVQRLGLPEAAINPLVARSFAAHLPFLGKEAL